METLMLYDGFQIVPDLSFARPQVAGRISLSCVFSRENVSYIY